MESFFLNNYRTTPANACTSRFIDVLLSGRLWVGIQEYLVISNIAFMAVISLK